MKPIEIKNECGETIEIKFDADGVIKIRHSDIDRKYWGILREYSKVMRDTKFQSLLAENGLDVKSPEAEIVLKQFSEGKHGGYIMLGTRQFTLDSKEVALIHQAVKQAGGIVPNWSSRS